jgi:hypothetical protein
MLRRDAPLAMKRLHKPNLWCWSGFDTARNLDFNSYLWVREGGNVVIDPLALIPHDRDHLMSLGGAALIVVTNSDHTRAAGELAAITGAPIAGPAGEKATFPLPCARWLADGDELVPGATVLALAGSKTPGELALVIEGDTLVTGDLVRAHQAGSLNLLPPDKLSDPAAAKASLGRLCELPDLAAVLVGDGWPVFRDGLARLRELHAAS